MNCLRAELYVRSRDDRVTKLQKIDTLKLRFSKLKFLAQKIEFLL